MLNFSLFKLISLFLGDEDTIQQHLLSNISSKKSVGFDIPESGYLRSHDNSLHNKQACNTLPGTCTTSAGCPANAYFSPAVGLCPGTPPATKCCVVEPCTGTYGGGTCQTYPACLVGYSSGPGLCPQTPPAYTCCSPCGPGQYGCGLPTCTSCPSGGICNGGCPVTPCPAGQFSTGACRTLNAMK